MPSWRPIKITAHRKEKEKAKKKEDAERTKNGTGIPEGTIRKAGPDETALPPRQREAHTRPRRENDKRAGANFRLLEYSDVNSITIRKACEIVGRLFFFIAETKFSSGFDSVKIREG